MIWAAVLNALARLLGRVLPFMAVWVAARRDANQARKIEGLEDYAETRKRVDMADVSGGDAAADREWLRRRGAGGRL